MGIGTKIRALREHLGWSQAHLGEAAGVSQATLSALEKRDSSRSVYLVPIARALSIALEDLRDLPLEDLKTQIERRLRADLAGKPAAMAAPHVPISEREAHVLRLFNELHPSQQAQFVSQLETMIDNNRAIFELYRARASTPRHR